MSKGNITGSCNYILHEFSETSYDGEQSSGFYKIYDDDTVELHFTFTKTITLNVQDNTIKTWYYAQYLQNLPIQITDKIVHIMYRGSGLVDCILSTGHNGPDKISFWCKSIHSYRNLKAAFVASIYGKLVK